MLQISVAVLAAWQTRPPSNPMRVRGRQWRIVMGAAGTTERERLLGRGTRTMVCAFKPASDGWTSSSASRRVVLPVHLARPN